MISAHKRDVTLLYTGLQNKGKNTYNSGYSLVVTHLTTNPPVRCLNRAERTGSLVFNVLWSYVKGWDDKKNYILAHHHTNSLVRATFQRIKNSVCGSTSTEREVNTQSITDWRCVKGGCSGTTAVPAQVRLSVISTASSSANQAITRATH